MKTILSVVFLVWLCLGRQAAFAQLRQPTPKTPQKAPARKPAPPARTSVSAKSKARSSQKPATQKKRVTAVKKPTVTLARTPSPTPKPPPAPPAQAVNQQAEYDRQHRTQSAGPVRKQKKAVTTASPSQQRYQETGNDPAFGLKGGLSLMTQTTSGQASTNKTGLMGYQGGVFLQIAGGNHFSLQPELNYIQKGIRYAYNSDYDQLTAIYIDLPILLKRHFGTGRLTANVYAGPFVGYWWIGKLENQTDDQKLKLNYEFDSDKSDGYADNRIDYGAIGGVGLSFSTGSGYILLEGRYQYGLSDIASLTAKPSGYMPTYNRGFQASIGYAIKF